MAFKPERGKFYYLVAQHSGKVLGARSGASGAHVVQQAQGDEMTFLQQFEFHSHGLREFYIKPRHHDLYLDILGVSKDNGAPLTLCSWHGNAANQRFQFISGGNGYYYLRAAHSGKMLDVSHYSTADDAAVIQHDQNPHGQGPNQLFKPVPVDSLPSTSGSMDAHPYIADETSDRLKDLVAGIAGSTPEVGSALKGLVQFLWPSGQLTIFQQMRSYVEALMKELISQERIIDLDKRLSGIYTNLKRYQDAVGVQKGQWFTTVLGNLNDAEPYFLDTRDPEKSLPYFVALGTIKLTMLREQVLFYQQIYGEADQKRAEHLKEFHDTLRTYLAASRLSRTKAMHWRLGKISFAHTQEHPVGILGPTTTDIYTAHDALTGWTASYRYNSLTGGTPDAEGRARSEYEGRRLHVEAQFGVELDAFLTPSYLWKYLNPEETAKPNRTRVRFTTGPYAGRRHQAFTDNPNGAPITRVKIHAGDRLDGVELFYGDVSGGLHGKVGGSMHCDVTLEAGEAIVAAYGTHGEVMHSLWFETNRGRVFGAGIDRVHAWSADPPESVRPTLTHIAGFQGSGHIDGLTMHWEYWREE